MTTLTDDGGQLLVSVLVGGVGMPSLEVGLWSEHGFEISGYGYMRQPVPSWSPARPVGDGWVTRARPVVWDRVGVGGWGTVEGWFLATPLAVLQYVAFDEPVVAKFGDRITVTPEVRVG